MDKVLVRLYVPFLDEQYDVWIPVNKEIYQIIKILIKSLKELSGGHFQTKQDIMLYNKLTAKVYDIGLKVKDTDIRNGSEIVLI